jgi:hypothetical protein
VFNKFQASLLILTLCRFTASGSCFANPEEPVLLVKLNNAKCLSLPIDIQHAFDRFEPMLSDIEGGWGSLLHFKIKRVETIVH